MPWQQRIYRMIGEPVGISFRDGTGSSGVLCSVQDNILYVIVYLYQSQFALKQYPFDKVQDVNTYPSCNQIPRPFTPVPRVY